MEGYLYCQSCGTPLDRFDNLGTEKDHSKSIIYCDYCYQDGEYTHPDMTINDMKAHIRLVMQSKSSTEADMVRATNKLRSLLRWCGIPIIHRTCQDH